jgi:hypothetical protein
MAAGPKRPEPYSRAIDRELIELAKTMDLDADEFDPEAAALYFWV